MTLELARELHALLTELVADAHVVTLCRMSSFVLAYSNRTIKTLQALQAHLEAETPLEDTQDIHQECVRLLPEAIAVLQAAVDAVAARPHTLGTEDKP